MPRAFFVPDILKRKESNDPDIRFYWRFKSNPLGESLGHMMPRKLFYPNVVDGPVGNGSMDLGTAIATMTASGSQQPSNRNEVRW